ncbi:hypothetical protein SAMN04487969_10675 [Paenibacillus algorifonticola]|uniref:Uncharacterized protein n=1 Tax=Paenibacillus algorifonticola TaxID=684063 RepID=A0A1I2D488_9BACL|nr:hypothetical protein [Paenibacillus algorifonticola]SFE74883.1 hypothetical protein SAMN04487969_10675 [Paenibacillus algorifonticola]
MEYAFVIEPQHYEPFENDEEQLEKCQEWGLLSEKASKAKTFYYKGNGLNVVCSIVGFVDKMTAVIQLDNDQKHCIHPSYLKEMQAASYGAKHTAHAEASEASDGSGSEAAAATGEAQGAEGNADASFEAEAETGMSSTKSVEEMLEEAGFAFDSVESAAAIPDAVEEAASTDAADSASDPAEQTEEKPKSKAKKEKAPKLVLPEEKVKMIATVKEFTTVPNHFSDNDDEVVIYEAVSITEPETPVGEAWSSHSATLKKQELEVGDIITFEAKIVAKKLTKHPVAYKINNPAKINKEEA